MITFSVLDDARLLALHDGDGGVGGSQVNTNDLALHLLGRLLGIPSHERRTEGGLCDGRGAAEGRGPGEELRPKSAWWFVAWRAQRL